jgi:hypothetical protein
MSLPFEITYIVNKMYEYQKKHNIEKECITNTSYLLDNLIHNGFDVKAKAVLAVYDNDENSMIINCHIVVQYKDYIIDPSYEVFSKNPEYYDKFHLIKKIIDDKEIIDDTIVQELSVKDICSRYMKFIETANIINKRDKLYIIDKQFYNSQADYVEQNIKMNFTQLYLSQK